MLSMLLLFWCEQNVFYLTYCTKLTYHHIFSDNRLFDAVSELRHDNLSLTLQNEKLRQEGLQSGPGSSDSRGSEKSSVNTS